MMPEKEFKAIITKLEKMSDKQLATLSFEVWMNATNRAAEKTGQEIEELVSNALKGG